MLSPAEIIRRVWPARPFSYIDGIFVFDDGLPPPSDAEIEAAHDQALALHEADMLSRQQIKEWASVEAFVEEFSLSECAAVEMSANPQIAALRFKLKTWQSPVHANHPLVQDGMAALVAEGIITEERKNTILLAA